MSCTSTLIPVSFSNWGASVFFTTVPHVAGKKIARSVTLSAAAVSNQENQVIPITKANRLPHFPV
jgi:hypothetical protein